MFMHYKMLQFYVFPENLFIINSTVHYMFTWCQKVMLSAGKIPQAPFPGILEIQI